MRLGVFGGTFDPVHYGHLLLAESCREQCRLDAVWFVPAAVPPHKQQALLSSAEQRIEMLTLAVSGHTSFAVSRLEVDRGGVSYTVDTLAALAAEDPARDLYLLLGADSLDDLPLWREPQRIAELAHLVAVCRPGSPPPDFERLARRLDRTLTADRLHVVEMPEMGLSATDLRHRAANGRSLRYRTPRAVEQYIATHAVYRNRHEPADGDQRPARQGPCGGADEENG